MTGLKYQVFMLLSQRVNCMADLEVFTDTTRSVLSKIGWQILMPADSLVNWDNVVGIAWDFARVSDMQFMGVAEAERTELVEIYEQIIGRISPLIAEYLREPWPSKSDKVMVFDRAEWIVVNIENLKSLLSGVSRDYWEALQSYLSLAYPIGQQVAKKVSEVSLTSEIGFLFGYLARKVLAQYDFGLPRADGMVPEEFFYFVEPNILHLEHKLDLDPVNLRLWIALHEVTHSYQFKSFPWLREYINSLINDYLAMVDEAIRCFRDQSEDGIIGFSCGAGWLKSVLSADSRRTIKKVQALMCLVEGYSEHVMMHVGKQFAGHEQMIGLFKERRTKKNIAEKTLEKLIGFDFKLKQYKLGEIFASYVAEQEGITFLNQVWKKKDNLPTWNEIHDPELWIKRMRI
jgi:coenzyme F420 biosynthesis associated uncharacterized protein